MIGEIGYKGLARLWNMPKSSVRNVLDDAYNMNSSFNKIKDINPHITGGSMSLIKEPYSAFGVKNTLTALPREGVASGEQLSLFGNMPPVKAAHDNMSLPFRNQKGQFSSKQSLTKPLPDASSKIKAIEEKQLGLPFKDGTKFFDEMSGSSLRQNAATIGNALIKNGLGGLGKTGAMASVASGLVGGAFFGAGAALFPNNFEYEGMTKPILKGALMGAALGATHTGAGAMMKKYAQTNPAKYDFARKTQSAANHWLTKGAIAAATFAGVGETHLTRPISPINGV